MLIDQYAARLDARKHTHEADLAFRNSSPEEQAADTLAYETMVMAAAREFEGLIPRRPRLDAHQGWLEIFTPIRLNYPYPEDETTPKWLAELSMGYGAEGGYGTTNWWRGIRLFAPESPVTDVELADTSRPQGVELYPEVTPGELTALLDHAKKEPLVANVLAASNFAGLVSDITRLRV